MSKNKNRELFSSKFGFILSCIGAAIGLGNIWIFLYKLGFVTVPSIFQTMKFGQLLSALFFLSIIFASI